MRIVHLLVLSVFCTAMGGEVCGASASPPSSVSNVANLEIVGVIDQQTTLAVLTIVSSFPRVLNVVIDSPGGDMDAANIIVRGFKALTDSGSRINCLVTGKAMSAAFFILQACSVRIAYSHAELMIHEPSMMYAGKTPVIMPLKALRGFVRELGNDSEKIADVVAPRMKMSFEAFHKKLDDGDWTMTPAEAIINHALDRITN